MEPGQRWLLVGGNGAGKTQLLKLVAGSVWPKPTDRALRRYRLRGEIADAPAGVMEEIARVIEAAMDASEACSGERAGQARQRTSASIGPGRDAQTQRRGE